MYKVTYLILSAYSGMLFFIYIPAIKFMLDVGWNSNSDITTFTVYVWLTWIIKPYFGYLCDYYPIFKRKIIPYVVIACIVNITTLGVASQTDFSNRYPVFIAVMVVMFTCFSLIDAAARNLLL